MQKWEYYICKVSSYEKKGKLNFYVNGNMNNLVESHADYLDSLGKMGWEVVSWDASSLGYNYLLKRPIEE